MAQGYVSPGWGSSADYAAAGLPWVFSGVATSTTVAQQFNFEYVSKQITIKNNAAAGSGKSICFGFTRNGTQLGPQRYEVSPLEYITLDCRIKELYIIASGSADVPFSIHASLTLIPEYNMPILTASADGANWDGIG